MRMVQLYPLDLKAKCKLLQGAGRTELHKCERCRALDICKYVHELNKNKRKVMMGNDR
jgi:hypothetical protein